MTNRLQFCSVPLMLLGLFLLLTAIIENITDAHANTIAIASLGQSW